MTSSPEHILAYRGLGVSYGGVQAVAGLSLELAPGRVFGLVGESGSGKSTVLRAACGQLPRAAQVRGSVRLAGEELIGMSERDLRVLRGGKVACIFQDAAASFDPLFTVGSQFDELLRAHGVRGRAHLRALERDLLASVGFSDPERVLSLRPHNLSGGMCQRAAIAMGLSCDARVLLADEPTSALDVTSQAHVLALLRAISRERGCAVLLVSHDIAAVAQVADEVGVMYRGHLVECGPAGDVFAHPLHPYTRDLIAAVPRADRSMPQAASGSYDDLGLRVHGGGGDDACC